jgi:hypothetical protein
MKIQSQLELVDCAAPLEQIDSNHHQTANPIRSIVDPLQNKWLVPGGGGGAGGTGSSLSCPPISANAGAAQQNPSP